MGSGALVQGRVELPVLPDAPPLVALSGGLSWRADQLVVRGRVAVDGVPPSEVAEARRLLPVMERQCVPAPAGQIDAWLALVALGVANPPEPHGYVTRLAMIADTSGDLPWVCWTRDTRRAFARRGKGAGFFPSDAEVDDFLRPIGRAVLRRRDVLLAVIDVADREAKAPPVDVADEWPAGAEDRAAAVARCRDAAIAALRGSALAAAAQTVGGVAVPRPVSQRITGERLWTMRNRARVEAGLPPLPRPDDMEGYGR